MLTRYSCAIAGALSLFASSALAAPTLVFVSTRGTDATGCGTISAPCRSLQVAQDAVATGGYINILDPGEYAAVSLTKSVNIVNESRGAALVRANAPFASAIGVNVNPLAIVRLRGLTIEGNGPNTWGVIFNLGKRLELADSVIRNATGDGVFMNNRNNPTFVFSNTTIANNGGFGVHAAVSGGYATDLRLTDNFLGGMQLSGASETSFNAVVIENSSATNAPGGSADGRAGFAAQGAVLVLRGATLRGFPFGVIANSAIIRLSRSTLTGNAVAAKTPGAPMIESSGDNVIRGNTDDALGAFTAAPLH
ncbi:right-handed parallel beta-helix repeat-containing protein [Methylocystis sp. WRRC1]|uniref:right-handed parallel beta-helix repeat-containing protein n=1 Tax=Methylocystis sp. WRRC1 TaxID=1732014 RepID=UPI001D14DB0C|nr:right-handed parallel beta-helix repeat-containing protein [Methylocystis sp. WRRC1]MCC3245548.1 right-handed parallel beta-helix repeat-containing protein [Methylocystis sp. WRRC1]